MVAAAERTGTARAGTLMRLRSLIGAYARAIIVLSPTIVAVVYYMIFATPRFASEAQFIVRTASKPAGSLGLGALLQMTGLSRSQDDIYTVQSYITSRDAIRDLEQRLPLRAIYGHASADAFARYPSLVYRSTFEDFHRYMNTMVTTVYASNTGITMLRVQAFEAEHARRVAHELLDMGERVVNRMNQRIHADLIRVAQDEVARNEKRMVDAQIALTKFRNSELMIDPAGSSLIVTEVIARLSAEQTQMQTQIAEMRAVAPDNPQLVGLRRRVAALDGQITTERGRISSASDGLADKLAVYERLVLDREFAKHSLASAAKTLETARLETVRQQLYLERVVEPVAVDAARYPESARIVASVFGLNVVGFAILWLVTAGMREHRGG